MSVTFWPTLYGAAFSGAKLYAYEPGTTTAKDTYPTRDDAAANTNANTNPVVLNTVGEAQVWLDNQYKLVLMDSADAITYFTIDEVGDLSGTDVLPKNYVAGLAVTIGTDTDHDVDIATGEARDGDDSTDITVSSVITAAIDAAGANGLDTGAVAANTVYYVWVIDDSSGTNSPAGLFSLSSSAPTMPTGYDKKRVLAKVVTDVSSNIGIVFRADRSLADSPAVGFGGWDLLESQTASASSSLDFVSGLDGTYDQYAFVLSNILPATDSQDLRLLLSDDGGATFEATGYQYHLMLSPANGDIYAGQGSGGGGATTYIRLTGNTGNVAGEAASGIIYLAKPGVAAELKPVFGHTVCSNGSGVLQNNVVAGGHNNGAAVNGAQFAFASGNIASGSIAMYGLRK